MKNFGFGYFIFIIILLLGNPTPAANSSAEEKKTVRTLEDLLRLSQEQAEILKSLDLSIQALETEIRSRDLELSTKLSTELSWIQDRQPTLSSPNRREDSQALELSLLKPFATGTSLIVNTGYLLNESLNTGTNNVIDWELKITQALWRNSLGRSTGLRRESDRYELHSRRHLTELQRQNFFIELENTYWDLLYYLKEEEIRQSNIRRSEILEKWIRSRISRSAAEPVDLLQVQALGSSSRLDLISSQNRIAEYKNKIQQLLPGLNTEQLQLDLSQLEKDRPSQSTAIDNTSPKLLRLDALANRALEKKTHSDWERTKDTLAPSLDVFISYGKNGIDNKFQDSWREAQNSGQTNTQVGLLFSVELDEGLKKDRALSGKFLTDSVALQTRQLEHVSALEWADLARRIDNLKKQALEAKRLANFQKDKSQKEQNRLRLGRSTVFQAVTFETDAANAELRYYQTLTTLRKTEARTRVFTKDTETL